MPVPPPTAYPSGTKLTVGSHEVEIIDFIGEGGFAHVYTVNAQPPVKGQDITCLKRVQVPDKAYLNLLRAEVDAMQRLRGAPNIVQYFDSHAERMSSSTISDGSAAPIPGVTNSAPNSSGQYEVFVLMEFCERGGLIDFMNTRLRDQLREHEILKIMYDITRGLASMHYLQPPLLHRDLKIENVLITGSGDYILCDFGSVSPVLRPPKSQREYQVLEDDIQHHTTVQYRAPEMIDLTRGHPINEKSDIWALGIFLYKLCYYTTPFERPNQSLDQFQQLILQGQFSIPARPAYSDRLRNMIRVLLQPDPRLRPNVYQVMQEICSMRRVDTPIPDIYSRTFAQAGPTLQPAAQIPQQMPAPQVMAAPLIQVPPQIGPGFAGVPSGVPQQVPSMLAAGTVDNQKAQNMPAPGQVPVPGVLLTSPMQVPTSPISRSVSPLDDPSLRYPSLEELDRSQLKPKDSIKPVPMGAKPKTTGPEGPKITSSQVAGSGSDGVSAFTGRGTSFTGNDQERDNLIDFDDHAGRKAQLNPDSAARTASSTSSGIKPGTPVSSEAQRLHKILNGISEKSSTVIMDNKPQEKNLSSVDFLRALRQEESSGHHSHHHHHLGYHGSHGSGQGKPRRPSVQMFKSKQRSKRTEELNYDDEDYEFDDDDEDSPVEPNARFGEDRRRSSEDRRRSRDDSLSDMELYQRDTRDKTFDGEPSVVTKRAHNARMESRDADRGSGRDKNPVLPSRLEKPAPLRRTTMLDNGEMSPRESTKPAKPLSPKPVLNHSKSTPEIATKPKITRDSASATAAAKSIPGKPTVQKPMVPRQYSRASTLPAAISGESNPKSYGSAVGTPGNNTTNNTSTTSMPNSRGDRTSVDSVSFQEHLKPKPRPKSMMIEKLQTQSTTDLETFKPSNSIQQRVHLFLNGHDRQHPPRRTARGYGRFTDAHGEIGNDRVLRSSAGYMSDSEDIPASTSDNSDEEARDYTYGYASEGVANVDARHHRSSHEFVRRSSFGDMTSAARATNSRVN